MRLESNIPPLSEFVACPTRHPTWPIFASLEVMPRVSIVLHLPIAYDDITRQLASDNDNYKISAHSILHEFAVENEVMITSHPEIGRELHVWCTDSSKVLKSLVSSSTSWTSHGILISYQLSAWMIHLWLQSVPYSHYRHLQLARHRDQLHLLHHDFDVIFSYWCCNHHLVPIEKIHARCGSVLPGHACYLLSLHSTEMNDFKPRMIGIALVVFFYCFVLFSCVFYPTSVMMGKLSVYGPIKGWEL